MASMEPELQKALSSANALHLATPFQHLGICGVATLMSKLKSASAFPARGPADEDLGLLQNLLEPLAGSKMSTFSAEWSRTHCCGRSAPTMTRR